jgi:hypothetical protein
MPTIETSAIAQFTEEREKSAQEPRESPKTTKGGDGVGVGGENGSKGA